MQIRLLPLHAQMEGVQQTIQHSLRGRRDANEWIPSTEEMECLWEQASTYVEDRWKKAYTEEDPELSNA